MTVDLIAGPFGGQIAEAVSGLNSARAAWRQRQSARHRVSSFPEPGEIARAVTHLSAALYPIRLGGFRGGAGREDDFVARELGLGLEILRDQVACELDYWQAESHERFEADHAETILRHFAAALADVRRLVDSDVEAAFVGDPAARSVDEILISYPGAIAVLHHRLAHPLHQFGAAIVARIISELANARTGIDIHPGATIGRSFFIDHGTGVVIGETAIIGANVRLYQHVTLGARSPLGLARLTPRERFARHPIVEDNVVIYAGATILGRVTIGRGSTIGGNVWLLDDVPAGSLVVQPGAIRLQGQTAQDFAALLPGAAA